jgi:photosystem II stability/assembly factor-like uncharacterized protein
VIAVGGDSRFWGITPVIIRSTDHGLTWEETRLQVRQRLYGITFTGADAAVAVGESGIALQTKDGGRTWVPLDTGTEHWLAAVSVAAGTGLAVGADATLITTRDSGTTWSRLTKGAFPALHSIDATRTGEAIATGDPGYTLRSTNGGEDWSPHPQGPEGHVFGSWFTDSLSGWAVGQQIHRTNDGGMTWTRQDKPRLNTALFGVSFGTGGTGVVTGAFGVILRTTDGGERWERVRSPTVNVLLRVWFLDDSTAIAVGGAGIVVRSTDGGATWSVIESGTRHFLHGLYFLDARHGWAVGSLGLILETTDGGQTWAERESGTEAHLRSILFADERRGLVSGDGGTVLLTTDGGRNWTRHQAPTLESLRAETITEDGQIFVAGARGTLLELRMATAMRPEPGGVLR